MAEDEQFSLCWNNFNSNLSAGFHESLLRGDLVDVTLAAEGQLVKAHRLILSVCSPYFRKMFTQMPVNQHAFIFLKDVSHSALKDLIQFIYCGEVNVKQDALPAFISTAEALQIKGLTESGDSVPVHQSPVKEDIPAVPVTASIPTPTTATASAQRSKTLRSRIQSYKIDSEESGDDKVVQIQASSSHHVTAPQIQTQTTVVSGLKRGIQRTIPSQISKRTKLSTSASNDGLELSDSTTSQVQTVQIVKQLPAQVIESEYIELPIESINPKAEPDYTEETAEIETVDAETEQDNKLSEQGDQGDADDEGNYVEDEAYGEMGISKYDDSYLTEGEDGGKPSVSGFVDSYTSDGGTGTEQSTQAGPLEYIHSQRGYPLLVLYNFLYRKNRGKYWRCIRCTKHKCRSRVILNDKGNATCLGSHTHGPETAKILFGRKIRDNNGSEITDGVVVSNKRLMIRQPHCKADYVLNVE
ncbi:modifier of mdg4 isoform X2 [Anopheles nili]|uniref:modifier of mdg4 isoform X2 n=1 Tax=Anopheles nili TaxID=185578 RepID=UPI00237AFA21|nr:modifier of mdg4 isoform X2 [Anopheles nili]